jgi:hypothetical protein
MKKPYFGLAVAVATLASAIGSALPACAVNFVYGNVTYDVTTHIFTEWNDLWPIITSQNALWGDRSGLAEGLAGVVKGDLGYPNVFYFDPNVKTGPYFVYGIHTLRFYPTTISSFSYASTPTYYQGQYEQLLSFQLNYSDNSMPTGETYATATIVPDAVPEPLTILGSIAATGFMAVFNRIKNKKEK